VNDRETEGLEDQTAASAEETADETATGSEDGAEGETETGGRARSPWASFAELQENLSDMVDSALRNVAPITSGRYPRYDLIEIPDEGYWILMDLPGLQRDELDVTTVGDELTVSGRRARPELPDGAEVRRSERGYGHFRRSIRLPADVDVSRIGAKLDGGVLRLTLPRRGGAEEQKVEIE
jgi:HSP20 family protein